MSRPQMLFMEGGITIRVTLPELTDEYTNERPTAEMVERASEAAISAMPQAVDIYIDGEDKPPARVEIDPWNIQDADNWSIE